MRYFSYNEYDENNIDGGCIYTVSEEEIRKEYWPYWYSKMCEKYGKEVVDRDWSFEDCLTDWVNLNRAWSST